MAGWRAPTRLTRAGQTCTEAVYQKKKRRRKSKQEIWGILQREKKRWENINCLVWTDQTCTAAIYVFSVAFYAEVLRIKRQNESEVCSGR